MIVYSIYVKGYNGVTHGVYESHSKNVYTHTPSPEEVNNFIDKCSLEFVNLDVTEPYNVQIIEHPVIEN